MNRRTILKSLVAVPAAAALPAQDPAKPPLKTVDESPKVETTVADVNAEPVTGFFTREQFAALSRLAEIIEPSSSELPGAKEACAAAFLDFLLSQSPASRQDLYRTGLDRLNADSARHFNKSFAALNEQQTATVLEPLLRPWTYEDPADPLEHFLRDAKADISDATRNSYQFIAVASKGSRRAGGVGDFWYPIY